MYHNEINIRELRARSRNPTQRTMGGGHRDEYNVGENTVQWQIDLQYGFCCKTTVSRHKMQRKCKVLV